MSNEKLDILIEGMNELRLVAHALMDRQDELDAKMEALTMDVHQLKADVAELKQDVAILKQDVALLKQDVAELREGQDRHERILETLALRALEWNNFRLDFIRKSS
ncbi:hypothetical protein [Brevibacillus formosus]|uniref:hypothetical protein n=1 Tax=Brevibacillus formosus TaxID=54913 RepID=UPI003F1CA42C